MAAENRDWARLLLLQLLLLVAPLPFSLPVSPPLVGWPACPSCASCWGAAVDGYILPPSPLLQREFDTLARFHTLPIKFESVGYTRGGGGGAYCTLLLLLLPLLLLLTPAAARCLLLLLAGRPTPRKLPLHQGGGVWSRGGGGVG